MTDDDRACGWCGEDVKDEDNYNAGIGGATPVHDWCDDA